MSEFVGKVSKLALYPVKSGGRLEVDKAFLGLDGFKVDGIKDHGLVVVRGAPRDGFHDVITQRDKRDPRDRKERPQSFAELALIQPSLGSDGLSLSWDGDDRVFVPSSPPQGEIVPVRVWEYEGPAVEVPQLSEWASDNLHYGVRVVSAEGHWDRMSRQII